MASKRKETKEPSSQMTDFNSQQQLNTMQASLPKYIYDSEGVSPEGPLKRWHNMQAYPHTMCLKPPSALARMD